MQEIEIKVMTSTDDDLPSYAKEGDSGVDLKAILGCKVPAYSRTLVDTGLYTEIPLGFELQIRSRSGLALKQGLIVLNSPGTIDSSYRGGISVIIFNTTDREIEIKKGDRIAQAVLCPVYKIKWNHVTELTTTNRGTGGFGSTGVTN
jgi:dUTP pyrophosphatase